MATALRIIEYPSIPVLASSRAAARPLSAAEHVAVFDGLRALAIAGVVWYHVWLVTGQGASAYLFGSSIDLRPFAETGFLGVDLFFFVSGFCLFYPYARTAFEGTAPQTLAEFARRRIWKILPSYYVALAVFSAMHWSWFASPADGGRQILLHASFLHPLFSDSFGSISGPFWTLGVEMQYYVLFPAIAWAFSRRPAIVLVALVLIAQTYRYAIAAAGQATTLYTTDQLPAVIDLFAAGMAAAYCIVRLRATQVPTTTGRLLYGASALAAASLIWVLLRQLSAVGTSTDSADAYAWLNAHRLLLAMTFFCAAIGSSFGWTALMRVLANPVCAFLAAISYNLYLWHLEIVVLLQNALGREWSETAIAIVSAFAAIVFAAAFTYAFERPVMRAGLAWKRSTTSRECGGRSFSTASSVTRM